MPPSQETLDKLILDGDFSLLLFPENTNRRFTSFTELREFFEGEKGFWGASPQMPFSHRIEDFLLALKNIREDRGGGDPSSILSTSWRKVKEGPDRIIYSCTPHAKFLKELQKQRWSGTDGAYRYICSDQSMIQSQDSNPMFFDGMLRASLFLNPQVRDERLQADTEAYEDLRGQITATLDQFKRDDARIRQSAEASLKEMQVQLSETLQTGSQKFADTRREWETKYGVLDEGIKTQFTELKELYEEKLRLEAPASQWEALEGKYRTHGLIMIWSTVGLMVAASAALGYILYNPPDSWKENLLNTAGTIKSTILVTVGISLVVYLSHLLIRLANSSYHLARDARERCQLTHIYLALLNEKAIEEKDRAIVLTALFSRSDSGLLRHDSSPALPLSVQSLLESLRGKG